MHNGSSRSSKIRARLNHPIIDSDAHTAEFEPAFFDFLQATGGRRMVERYKSLPDTPFLFRWYTLTPEQRRELRTPRPIWWGHPSGQTLDRATSSLPPSRQMQADFATIRRGRDRLSVFIATLEWSRATYVEFVTDERLETVLSCHEGAFYFFGGVPREVLYDNMRTVVTDRDKYGPELHRYNRTFLDLARHHSYLPRLCRPRRAKTKRKVERFIGYLRGSF